MLTDQNGATISGRDFMPYGEEMARTAYSSGNDRQWPMELYLGQRSEVSFVSFQRARPVCFHETHETSEPKIGARAGN